jgi:hypothetical protein
MATGLDPEIARAALDAVAEEAAGDHFQGLTWAATRSLEPRFEVVWDKVLRVVLGARKVQGIRSND